jgi:hypothetical protein
MILLEKILNKYNFPKRTIRQEITIDEIEKLINFQLPEDYKFYLDNFKEREGFIGPEYLRLWDLENLLENNNGYQIITYLADTLAIGTNMGGEFIAIEYLGQHKYHIVISPFIDLNKENYIEIGASFTDMLNRLDSGKEWFSND